MTKRTLRQLIRLASARLDECRRRLAVARDRVNELEDAVRGATQERRLALSGGALPVPSLVAECVAVADRRCARLARELGAAATEHERARGEVLAALREARSLERLAERRSEREAAADAKAAEAASGELARVLDFRRRREVRRAEE
jgi:hypothetical protein